MLWEASVLDPNTGITFHGKTIAQCQSLLPKPPKTGTAMLPEAMFWYLLTGQIPTESQIRAFSKELASKASLTPYVLHLIRDMPKDMHPMTKLSIGVSALAHGSTFATAYAKGLNKAEYWEKTFDDAINLIAKLPHLAAIVYRTSYFNLDSKREAQFHHLRAADPDPEQDWSYNFAAMMGLGGEEHTDFQDLMRLYLALHGDHEGGNVSAHTTHLVASALSDHFLSYSAGLLGLAGPLHGLAAQEVLRWILQMKEAVPENPSQEDVKKYLWDTLKSGRVVPGYGHAVLRKTDPRFEALMDFAKGRQGIMDDPVFRLVKLNSEVAPGVLMEHGKTVSNSHKRFHGSRSVDSARSQSQVLSPFPKDNAKSISRKILTQTSTPSLASSFITMVCTRHSSIPSSSESAVLLDLWRR